LSRNINSQQYLIDVFGNAYNLLESLPSEQKVYVYQFLSEVVGRQSEQTMITLVMDLEGVQNVLSYETIIPIVVLKLVTSGESSAVNGATMGL